jgi:ATP-dependent RNA helicase DeaD
MQTFTELGLSPQLLATLQVKGFEEPTEIQALTIPHLLTTQSDIIAQAQTGTGKTAAFALPLIELLDPSLHAVQAIVLAPTRELVVQVCEEISSLRGSSGLSVVPIYGGQSFDMQLRQLKRGVSIVVGTPGRVLDHLRQGTLKIDTIKFFVLDEADEMLNMGFIDDIETILQSTPAEKRVLLFSATMPERIKSLAQRYMRQSVHLKTKAQLTTNLTEQIYFEVAAKDKFEALCRIIDIETTFYGIIFCRTKIDVDELVAHLNDRGYSSDGLHGDISQVQREKILAKFRKQHLAILVATDVAARGIDINNLTHVINYSIPQNPEAYIHRIGRTGRAGNQGTAITFITPAEFRQLGFIKKITRADIRKEKVPAIREVISRKQEKIHDDICEILETPLADDYREWAEALLTEYSPEQVIGSILKHAFGKDLDESNYREISSLSSAESRRGKTMVEDEGKTRLFIAKGKAHGMNKSSLVDFIVKTAGTQPRLIDAVQVFESFSFITVPFAEAEYILKQFKKNDGGRKPMVSKARPEK